MSNVKIPVLYSDGANPKDHKRAGYIMIKGSEKQHELLATTVLMPAFDILPNGEKVVTAYVMARRTDVLHPAVLKNITDLETKVMQQYAERRDGDKGSGDKRTKHSGKPKSATTDANTTRKTRAQGAKAEG